MRRVPENIPEEPEAGVAYRDVKVDWSVLQPIVHPTDTDQAGAKTGSDARRRAMPQVKGSSGGQRRPAG